MTRPFGRRSFERTVPGAAYTRYARLRLITTIRNVTRTQRLARKDYSVR